MAQWKARVLRHDMTPVWSPTYLTSAITNCYVSLTITAYGRKAIRDMRARAYMCAYQPATELYRFRQTKLIPNAKNCRAGQSLHLHGGPGSTETQVALPGRWKRHSPLSCMVGPDVDILLVDRATHRDGPVESECAALCQSKTRVASVPCLHGNVSMHACARLCFTKQEC